MAEQRGGELVTFLKALMLDSCLPFLLCPSPTWPSTFSKPDSEPTISRNKLIQALMRSFTHVPSSRLTLGDSKVTKTDTVPTSMDGGMRNTNYTNNCGITISVSAKSEWNRIRGRAQRECQGRFP